jgi:hypothetical protein
MIGIILNTVKSNSWAPLANILYSRGIITEGYNPNRDVYERVYNLGGLTLTRDLHAFKVASRKTRHLVDQSAAIEVSRPGVSMTFTNMVDLSRRMWKLTEHPGYGVAKDAPFILHNKATGTYKFLPADRVLNARAMHEGWPRMPMAA